MPQLHEIIKKTNDTKKDKVFEKISYRPWDLQGDASSSSATLKAEQNKTESQEKVSDIQEINRTQIEHKSVTEPDTNRAQIGHKSNTQPDTNRTQQKQVITRPRVKPDTNQTQIRHTTGHEIAHKSGTNRTQICDKNCISSLTGIQRKSLFFIHENIRQTSSKTSEKLNQIHIAEGIKCNIGSVKTSIRRLENKQFVVREEYWPGRGGWSRYSIPLNIYTQIVEYQNSSLKNKSDTESDTNRAQIGHKSGTQPDTQPDTTGSSSSSFLNSKTTTTNLAVPVEFPDTWQNIDCEPLSELGFGRSHLMQLYKLNLDAEIVQASIYHFAFDLNRNKKREQIKTLPLGYFMGILRRDGCYNAPDNYISPRTQAMSKFLEHQKREQEALLRLEEEAKEPHFQAWQAGLAPEEIESLIPDNVRQVKISGARVSFLKSHFTSKIWPELRLSLGLAKTNS